jgi:transposase InsO family protein
VKAYFTFGELQELALPGLPARRDHIRRKALNNGWKLLPHPRRADAWVVPVETLPEPAQLELRRRAKAEAVPAATLPAPIEQPRRRGGRVSTIDGDQMLQAIATNAVKEWPRIEAPKLREVLAKHGGVMLGERCCARWLAAFKTRHQVAYAYLLDPDRARNRYEPAMGSLSAGIIRPNQRWEIDATASDVLLDEGRCTVYAIVDIYTRRGLIVPTLRATAVTLSAVFRHALLTMGVPEQVKIDNGPEFVSGHFKRICAELFIEHLPSTPYRPQEKGHVESFIGTFNHDWLPYMKAHVGANVAERRAIRGRRSFQAEREAPLPELVMSFRDFAGWCRRWVDKYNGHAVHSAIGMTPMAKLATAEPARGAVTDIRALDILLEEPIFRTVGKKGVEIGGHWYIGAELGRLAGRRCAVRVDPTDLGMAYLYDGATFLCEVQCLALSGLSAEEQARRQQAIAAAGKGTHRKLLKAARARAGVARSVTAAELVEHNTKAIAAPEPLAMLPGPDAYSLKAPKPQPTMTPALRRDEPEPIDQVFTLGIAKLEAAGKLPGWLTAEERPNRSDAIYELVWLAWRPERSCEVSREWMRKALMASQTDWEWLAYALGEKAPPAWIWELDGRKRPPKPELDWSFKYR